MKTTKELEILMTYNRIQFIGLLFNTRTRLSSISKYGQIYMGMKTFKNDIQDRCHILQECIKTSAFSHCIDRRKDTLKVFMAPEFYFRNRFGAYPIELVHNIMELMRTYTSAPHYKDWLFVLGTAVGYLEQYNSAKEIFNIALIQKGGTLSAESQDSLIVYKEYLSRVDFIRDIAQYPKWQNRHHRMGLIGDYNESLSKLVPVEGSGDISSKYINPPGRGKENTLSGLGGQSIFTIDGVTFGLEICLDHYYGRLRKSPVPLLKPEIKVHLVCSAGLSRVVEKNVACVNNGLIFHVDGNFIRTHLDHNEGDVENPKLKWKHYPDPSSTITSLELSTVPKSIIGKYSTTPDLKINVFPPKPLPASSTYV